MTITAEESLEQPTTLHEVIAQNQELIEASLRDHLARIDKLERIVAYMALGHSAVAEQSIHLLKQMPIDRIDLLLENWQRPYHELTPEAILHSEGRDSHHPFTRDPEVLPEDLLDDQA